MLVPPIVPARAFVDEIKAILATAAQT